jgi:teichuronic acid biosynthesis glycosyltransferase TuaC
MKKLICVSRLKSNGKISSITKKQMISIEKKGIEVSYFYIKKGGIFGYFSAIFQLRKVLIANSYDIVHAHYSLSGVVSALAKADKLVVSLMGSDVKKNFLNNLIIRLFLQNKWTKVIVKSENMLEYIPKSNHSKYHILPNGVDFDFFYPIKKNLARKELNWDNDKIYVLFAANPGRKEKHFFLAQEAIKSLKIDIELIVLNNIAFEMMPFYYNASDIILLTSEREGSPNVIKEAMACNRPIVTTNVGDVEKVIGDTKNCFIVNKDVSEISKAINEILKSKIEQTNGREKIEWLNETKIAQTLIDIYIEK